MGSPSFTSADHLSPSERETCKALLEAHSPGAVLLGAIRSKNREAVSPVFLREGVWVIRPLSIPQGLSEAAARFLTSLFERLQRSENQVRFSSGVWISLRPYYDEGFLGPGPDSKHTLLHLLENLTALHERQLWHGNIVISNVMRPQAGGVVLVDTALHVAEHIARVPASLPPSEQSFFENDSRAFLALTEKWLGQRIAREHPDLFACLDNQNLTPPSLSDIHTTLFYDGSVKISVSDDGSSLRSGRVIAPPSMQQGEARPVEERKKGAPGIESGKPLQTEADIHHSSQKDTPKRDSWTALLVALGVGLGIVWAVMTLPRSSDNQPDELVAGQEFDDPRLLWKRGDERSLETLAYLSVMKNDPVVQDTILDIVREDPSKDLPSRFIVEPLTFGFRKEWRDSLSPLDRQFLFYLAFSQYLKKSPETIEGHFSELHPGSILAALALLPLHQNYPWFSHYPLQAFLELPEPWKGVAQVLLEGKNSTLATPSSRAALILASGEITPEVLQALFEGSDSPDGLSQRSVLLLPYLALYPESAEKIFLTLGQTEAVAPLVEWFHASTVVSWASVPPLARVLVIGGTLSGVDLPLENIVDLLHFPVSKTQEVAMGVLQAQGVLPAEELQLIKSLAPRLSRNSTIDLFQVFRATGDDMYDRVQQFYASDPASDAVYVLLTHRTPVEDVDYFSVEAVRYLRSVQWKPQRDELLQLLTHSEPLVRSFAYSFLQVSDKKDRKILRDMISVEPDPDIRNAIKKKLEIFD